MTSEAAAERKIQQLTVQLAAVEQLLDVHEETVRQQSAQLEETLAMLQQKNAELENQMNVMMGREGRILELKQEINDLLRELGRPPKFGV